MKSTLKACFRKFLNLFYGDKTLDFKKFNFTVNYKDSGGRQYNSRSSYEEVQNSLYRYIADTLNPDLLIDVGANYGFTSLVFRQSFPNAKLILVEPSPVLYQYIHLNLDRNDIKNYEIIKAICGSQKSGTTTFSLNPVSSQDNRVNGQRGWKRLEVPSITLTDIIKEQKNAKSVFIKIDTQGFETQVFEGAFEFLDNSSRWLIKTEFAPHWLTSQGNNPYDLLGKLVDKFLVAEAPARTRFCRDQLHQIFSEPLQFSEIEGFIQYAESLNKCQLGWVDLYVAPKSGVQWMSPSSKY